MNVVHSTRNSTERSSRPELPVHRFLLWVDGVGGYLVCLDPTVVIGQPVGSDVDVPIMAELSRRHAELERQGETYVLRPRREVRLRGRKWTEPAVLVDGDVLELGPAVRLRFRVPSSYSATARLELVSSHRFPWAVEAVLLMAETCILGPEPTSHVVADDWSGSIVLYRQGKDLWCRCPEAFELNGRLCHERGRLVLPCRLRTEVCSLALEPVASSTKGVGQ